MESQEKIQKNVEEVVSKIDEKEILKDVLILNKAKVHYEDEGS